MSQAKRNLRKKIMLLGDIGVGKSSLIHRIIYDDFPLPQFTPAIAADWYFKDVQVGSQQVTLLFGDSHGAERFRPLSKACYLNTHCCMLVFDMKDARSFEGLQSWMDEYLAFCSDMNVDKAAFILLANKVDLQEKQERQISAEKIGLFCELNGNMPYFEISAKDGTNVNEVLNEAASLALQIGMSNLTKRVDGSINVSPRSTKKSCW